MKTGLFRGALGASVLAAGLLAIPFGLGAGLFDFLGGASEEDVAAAVKGNNAFAFDLYSKLRAADGDVVFSPYSVSSALAMTWAGARGETEKEMAATLHFGLGQEKLHPAMAALTKDLNKRGGEGKYELAVANKLWGQTGMKLLEPFLDITEECYGAGFEETDFAAGPEKARKAINDWCEKMTRGKIREPVPQGAISGATRLVLANAIYFKGMWASRFDKANTRDRTFTLGSGAEIETPTMWQKEEFRYGKFEDMSALEMDYVGEDLSMVILLPDKHGGLADLEDKLNVANLDKWLGGMHKTKVDVTLPRFKIEYGEELSKVLSEMGMPSAFDSGADFSGMTGGRDLFISKVIHKAMIDVNEEGTEAAAVTVVVMEKTAAKPMNIEFHADHPFVYMIRDKKTGGILFMGRLTDPG